MKGNFRYAKVLNVMMKLETIPEFYKTLSNEYDGLTIGRIVSQEKDLYRIITEYGEQNAQISGKFRYEANVLSDYPAVGDYVMVETNNAETAIIRNVLERKTAFWRKISGKTSEKQIIAANIDTLFICMSLNENFNLRRLERYMAAAWDSGAKPVIVLTKADLCDDTEEKIMSVENTIIGADIAVSTVFEKDGYDKVRTKIKCGDTVAFVGSSGVGKSTLINRLLGEDVIETNCISKDGRGRHTTTHREMYLMPNKAMIIDTPGMREFGVMSADDGIENVFSEITLLSAKCRFKNCTHTVEDGCAILEALKSGELSEKRWESFKKIKTENDYLSDTENYLESKEKKFKNIAKINKFNRKR